MAKILSLLIGAIAAALGAILLITWWYEFTFILKAVIPVIFILGGGIAVTAGLNELKDTLRSSKEK